VPATTAHVVDMGAAFQELGRRGLTRVLVEGGSTLAAVLLRAGLVDRLAWFHAPLLFGGDGIPAVAGFGLEHLADARRFERMALETVGDDVLETLRRR
jgi:diaminohydroxyphosphoribosylaminopyrimidine deaminase/5-amino-6-(5-phosphoribosylamino)uracil reductase